MKIKRMSFENIQNELSANEMRLIMAGSGSAPGTGFPGNPNPIQLPPVVITPIPGSNPYYPGAPSNPSIPGSGGSGGSGSGGGGGGGGGGVGGGSDPGYYYGNQPIDQARDLLNNYQRGSLSFQHFNQNAMTHQVDTTENSKLQESLMKVMGAFGVAVDSHNFTTAVTSFVSSEVNLVLQNSNLITGGIGVALGGVTAINNIVNNNGGTTGDWIAVGLTIASAVVILNPGTVVGSAAASAIVSTLSFVNDAVSIAGVYNTN